MVELAATLFVIMVVGTVVLNIFDGVVYTVRDNKEGTVGFILLVLVGVFLIWISLSAPH